METLHTIKFPSKEGFQIQPGHQKQQKAEEFQMYTNIMHKFSGEFMEF